MCIWIHYTHPHSTCPHASHPWSSVQFCYPIQQRRNWASPPKSPSNPQTNPLLLAAATCPSLETHHSHSSPTGIPGHLDYHTCPLCVALVQEERSVQCPRCYREPQPHVEFSGVRKMYVLWEKEREVIEALGEVVDGWGEEFRVEAPVWTRAMWEWEEGVFSDYVGGKPCERRACRLRIPERRDERWGRKGKRNGLEVEVGGDAMEGVEEELERWENAFEMFFQYHAPQPATACF